MPPPTVLFGREPDLAHLLDRVQRSGVTAVVARAQMGKSAVLGELAARITQQPDGEIFKAPLVGSTESLGETSDLLLRAVSSLYTRWIASSSFQEQGGVVVAQQNHDLIGRAGEVVGKLFKSLADKSVAPVADLVSDTLSGLASANRDLKSGGLGLPRLQTEQARDLLKIVANISKRPLVLIMDQWEKSPSLDLECNILDNFLRDLPNWPICHIVLGVRSEKAPLEQLTKLASNPLAAIEIFQLPDMHLDTPEAQRPLLEAVHTALPFTAAIPDAQILTLLDGYPGTLARWLATNVPPPITTYARLAQLADDANHYRYSEFGTELTRLKDFRPLAMRVCLLPYAATAEGYRKLRPQILAAASGAGLDELKTAGILETSSPPSFGHTKRVDAARAWFLANAHEELYDVAEALIFSLSARVQQLMGDAGVIVGSLSALRDTARQLDLSPVAQALAQSAASLLQEKELDSSPFTDAGLASSATESSVPLLSFGLFNFFNRANLDGTLLSTFLAGLRSLSNGFPQVSASHIQFAKALFNASNKESPLTQDRVALLDELRGLAKAYPTLGTVSEYFAQALFNAFNDVAPEADARRQSLYAELSSLANLHPDNITIQETYSRATHQGFLRAAKSSDASASAATFLNRLRELAAAYPSAPPIVLNLATGLRNAMLFARKEPSPDHMDALLQELQVLFRNHASDSQIARQLAWGLLVKLRTVADSEFPPSASAPDSAASLAAIESLLADVRALHHQFEPDPELGDVLATGLCYRVSSLAGEDAFSRRQSYLAEMRSLILAYPLQRSIQENQVRALFLTIQQASGTPEATEETVAPLLAEFGTLVELNHDSPVILSLFQSLSS